MPTHTAHTNDYGDAVGAQTLFEDYQGIAYKQATECARKYPKVVLKDLINLCLESLMVATRRHNPQKFGSFGSYAIRAVSWTIRQYLHREVFRKPKPSIDDVVGISADGNDITRGDRIADEAGRDEVQERLANNRFKAQPWAVIRTLKTLTKDERKVLTLLYLKGKEPYEVIAAYGGNYQLVNASHYHGITKLRAHFSSNGFSVDTSKSHRRLRYEGDKRGTGTDKAAMRRRMRKAQAVSVHKNHHVARGITNPKCQFCVAEPSAM